MKKRIYVLFCVLILVCLSGCTEKSATYTIFPIQQTDHSVDTQILHDFLTSSEDYSHNYKAVLRNVPDILSTVSDITPQSLQDKCRIYKFGINYTWLSGACFLLYDNEVFPIGESYGGWGITEFACSLDSGAPILYFIYSYGSGIHRSHIGAFDFNSKTTTDFGGLDHFWGVDIGFCLSEDIKTLGVCNAQITWSDDSNHGELVTKGDILYPDITHLNFTPPRILG